MVSISERVAARYRMAETFRYYVKNAKPQRVVYGPFGSEFEAKVAHLMTIPRDKFDPIQEQYGRSWPYHARDLSPWTVGTLSDEELEYQLKEPDSWGYKKVTLKKPSALKPHPSWKTVDPSGMTGETWARYCVSGDTEYLRDD